MSRIHGGLLLAVLAVGCSGERAPATARSIGEMEASAGSTEADAQTAMSAAGPRNAMAPSSASPSQSDEKLLAGWMRDYREALRAHAQVLAGRNDGRSQLAAAWLLQMAAEGSVVGEEEAAFAALLTRAGELAPDDPLVAWLERMNCPVTQPVCRREQAMARLQSIDPDNAAAWLLSLDAAIARGDGAGIDASLARAALAGHYYDRWNETGRFFDAALAEVALPARSASVLAAQSRHSGANVPPSEAELRAIYAIGMASGMTLPSHLGLTRSCMDPSASAARKSACLSVFARMAESDSLLARSIGLSCAVRLTAGTPAGAAWRERLRRFEWFRNEAIARSGFSLPPDYAQRLWRDGEIAALEWMLAAAGRPLTPPAGWLPANANSRALITTGRPLPRG